MESTSSPVGEIFHITSKDLDNALHSHNDTNTISSQTLPSRLADGRLRGQYSLLHSLLTDNNDYDLLPCTPAETAILQTIYTKRHNPQMNASISESDFKAILHATDELTSSSPSGRHYGLYKGIVDSAILFRLHTILVSLPLRYGFILQRWKTVTQIMLKKKEQPGLDKLRIIELFEADYNASVKILMRRLLWHQLHNNIVSDGTFRSIPGGSNNDAMFIRIFAFDLHRIIKHPLALVDNDAVSCYDCTIPHLSTKLFTVTGLSQLPTQTIFNPLIHKISHVATAHGISDSSISSIPMNSLFGIGQGNGAGPAAWHSHLLISIKTLQKLHQGYLKSDPSDQICFQQHLVSVVDNTSLILTATHQEINQLVEQTETLLNHWISVLTFTGGKLALVDKTNWWFSYYEPTEHKMVMHTNIDDGYEVTLKYSTSLP